MTPTERKRRPRKRSRTDVKPCPRCRAAAELVQLDSGHWIGTCPSCGAERPMHWSKVAARAMWNERCPSTEDGLGDHEHKLSADRLTFTCRCGSSFHRTPTTHARADR
jgi:hypothetical protein